MLEQESRTSHPEESILKRTPERRIQGETPEEESLGGKQEESSRRTPEEGTLKKESCKMNHQGGLLEECFRGGILEEEEALRRNQNR